jgi:hypothetical protein
MRDLAGASASPHGARAFAGRRRRRRRRPRSVIGAILSIELSRSARVHARVRASMGLAGG